MLKKFSLLILPLAMLTWSPQDDVAAKDQPCVDGTLIYWHASDFWVCMGYWTDGPACTLCYDEPIDVVG